jgi:hypothetical protein
LSGMIYKEYAYSGKNYQHIANFSLYATSSSKPFNFGNYTFFVHFFGGLEFVGHSFAYVAHIYIF